MGGDAHVNSLVYVYQIFTLHFKDITILSANYTPIKPKTREIGNRT